VDVDLLGSLGSEVIGRRFPAAFRGQQLTINHWINVTYLKKLANLQRT
jgi:hypothetical protein